jgi:hypothetical protein
MIGSELERMPITHGIRQAVRLVSLRGAHTRDVDGLEEMSSCPSARLNVPAGPAVRRILARKAGLPDEPTDDLVEDPIEKAGRDGGGGRAAPAVDAGSCAI